jgi:hypothetical protein
MLDPKYLVTITHQPSYAIGQFLTYSGGVTFSMRSYSTPLYIASMPEVLLLATGSSYTEALSKLLIVATASTVTKDDTPLSDAK